MSEISLADILNEEKEEVQTLHAATKRAGRPRAATEKATERVTLYFTKSDLERVEKYCHNERLKVGTFIKDTFFNSFNKKEDEQAEQILNIDKYLSEQDPEELGQMILNYLKPQK